MNYALIENGVVTNIIWLLYTNADDFPNAVPCGDLPVFIGDTYNDGKFYDSDGNEVESHYSKLAAKAADMEAALAILEVSE